MRQRDAVDWTELLVPALKLNASFAASVPRAGDLALISQSGAIAAGLVEWVNGALPPTLI